MHLYTEKNNLDFMCIILYIQMYISLHLYGKGDKNLASYLLQ